nr:MAG TPA: hypothetical protein [Caudoviricetes sp.]
MFITIFHYLCTCNPQGLQVDLLNLAFVVSLRSAMRAMVPMLALVRSMLTTVSRFPM